MKQHILTVALILTCPIWLPLGALYFVLSTVWGAFADLSTELLE
jgi:hypothetical protein